MALFFYIFLQTWVVYYLRLYPKVFNWTICFRYGYTEVLEGQRKLKCNSPAWRSRRHGSWVFDTLVYKCPWLHSHPSEQNRTEGLRCKTISVKTSLLLFESAGISATLLSAAGVWKAFISQGHLQGWLKTFTLLSKDLQKLLVKSSMGRWVGGRGWRGESGADRQRWWC